MDSGGWKVISFVRFYVSTADVVFCHGLLHCGFSAAFCSNSMAQQLYLHEMRIIFLNRASAETRMRLVVFVFFFSRDCKAGCSYFHGALSCLHSPILRSDSATIVITAGETVQVVCFGVGRYLCFLWYLLCYVLCSFLFLFVLHTTHLVHHCGKQWMRAKQCVCIAPSFVCFLFLLFSFFLSLPFFVVLPHFQSHHRRTFLLFLVA